MRIEALTDWEIAIGPERLILSAPGQLEAEAILEDCDRIIWGLRRWRLRECLIYFPGCQGHPYKISSRLRPDNYIKELLIMSDSVAVIDERLFLNTQLLGVVDSALVKVMDRLLKLSSEGIPAGLVMSNGAGTPNNQIWVNSQSEQLFRGAGKELVKVNTTKYWLPSDIERFYAIALDKSAGSRFDFTYQAQGSDDPNHWLKLTSDIEIVEAMGCRFRLAAAKDVREIPRPVNI